MHKKMQPGRDKQPLEENEALQAAARHGGFDTVQDYLFALHAQHAQRIESFPPLDDPRLGSVVLNFRTKFGRAYCGDGASLCSSQKIIKDDSVDLIMTSPPFGLVRKKDYGNEDADRYVEWFKRFAKPFHKVLKDSGSLVIDIGSAWKPGLPCKSLYHYELLIMLCREFGFHLAQEFFWWNPAKLPTPAEWVNIRRVRVKDAINCVWWLSKTPYPKASNRRILQPYSSSMHHLIEHGYKAKNRPSGHVISTKFQTNNKGAIPPNLIALANTESNGTYQRFCRSNDLPEHPARFPAGLPAFFIRFLTDKGDLVVDPFGGSCMTGAVAEQLSRRWICSDLDKSYLEGAKGRFSKWNPDCDLQIIKDKMKPYEIMAPQFVCSEDDTPLDVDGGKIRASKTRFKA